MNITHEQFSEICQALIAEGYNGKVKVIALSLHEKEWALPVSCPYLDNIDKFNCPFYANDNILR